VRLTAGAPGPAPQEALDYLRRKKLSTELDLEVVWGEQHARAFAVAGVIAEDLLTDIRVAVDAALAEGLTMAEFADRIDDVVTELGWAAPAAGGVPRRVKIIYETNMRTARAAGQWARIQRTKEALPFLRYSLGPSQRHRDLHVSWDGTVRRVDDAWWSSHFPPNGYGCKCRVRALDDDEAEKLGGVSEVPSGDPDPGWNFNPGEV